MPPVQPGKASAKGYLAGYHHARDRLTDWVPHSRALRLAKWTIREAIGPQVFSGLEEAKADVVGMFGLKWLVDHARCQRNKLEEYYASYLAGIFRTLRFGTGEAHGRPR